MKHSLLIGLACALGLPAFAQSVDSAPFPQGLAPVKAPDFAKWTETITTTPEITGTLNPTASPKTDDAKKPKTVITVTKTPSVRLIMGIDRAGNNSTIWCLGPYEIFQDMEYREPALLRQPSLAFIDFSRSDFPDLLWVSERNFAGTEMQDKRPLYVFRTQIKSIVNKTTSEINWEAKFDFETRLPVSFRKGNELHVYQFGDPPASPLEVPSKIKSMVEQEQRRLQELARKPPAG